MPFTLETFGGTRLLGPAGDLAAFPEKGLLAMVVLASRPSSRMARSELSSFLWAVSGYDSGAPLSNLRQLLSRVKARQLELGVEFLEIGPSDVALRRDDIVFDFDPVPQGDATNPTARLEQLLQTIRGQFLFGADVSSEIMQPWLLERRDFWIGELGSALEMAAAEHSDANSALIKTAAHRLIELDAYSEVAYRVLVCAYVLERRSSQARVVFDRYRHQLRSELGVQPSPDMLRLAASLFGEKPEVPAMSVAPPRPGAPPDAETATPRRPKLPRLLLLPPRSDEGLRGWSPISALIEDVTIGLCRAQTMAIVAPHTARHISASLQETSDLLRHHDVSYVLETNIQRRSREAFLYAALVHVADDEILWSESFPADQERFPAVYEQLIARIVSETASSIERTELAKIHTVEKPAAYQNFLLGRHSLSVPDLPYIRRARKFFRAALQDLPEYPAAIAGLARTEHLEWLITARGDRDLLRSAEAHAMDAIRMGADDAGGYHQLGVTKLYQGQFSESIEAFTEAEKRAPSYADLLADHADTLVHAADPALALDKIKRAIELNPLCPDLYWWTAAGAYFCLENYSESIVCIDRMTDQSKAGRLAAAAYAMIGDQRNARKITRRTLLVYPEFTVDGWLSMLPIRENWKREMLREGMMKAGFN